jgi:hypothetical protein
MATCEAIGQPGQMAGTVVPIWQQSTEVLPVRDVRSIGRAAGDGHSREVIRGPRKPYKFVSATGCSG